MDPALTSLLAASIAFVGSHVALSHPLRAPLAARLGEKGFLGLYSLVSLAAFAWMIVAFRAAYGSGAPAWNGQTDLAWAVASGLTWVALVLFLGSLKGNPATPATPAEQVAEARVTGVYAVTRHPMMWGFALWAVAHILVMPTPRSLILAGAILILALLGAHLQDQEGSVARHGLERLGSPDQLLAALEQATERGLAPVGGGADPVAGDHLATSAGQRLRGRHLALALKRARAGAGAQARASSTPALLWRSAFSAVSTICGALSPASSYCLSGVSWSWNASGRRMVRIFSPASSSPSSLAKVSTCAPSPPTLPSSTVTITSCVAIRRRISSESSGLANRKSATVVESPRASSWSAALRLSASRCPAIAARSCRLHARSGPCR